MTIKQIQEQLKTSTDDEERGHLIYQLEQEFSCMDMTAQEQAEANERDDYIDSLLSTIDAQLNGYTEATPADAKRAMDMYFNEGSLI